MRVLIELERRNAGSSGLSLVANIKASLPFVKSSRGYYTHRVRSANSYIYTSSGLTYKAGELHIAVQCWCGMTLLISKRKFGKFLVEPPDGSPVCATCEGRAIGAGKLGAREIAGRPVMYSPMNGAAA